MAGGARYASKSSVFSNKQSMKELTGDLRGNPNAKARRGQTPGWYTGSNTTCRRHIGTWHYKEYHARCKAGKFDEQEAAIPKAVILARKAAANKKKGEKRKEGKQTTLDGIARKVQTPTAFSRVGILDAVTTHVVVGDQVRGLGTHVGTEAYFALRPSSSRARQLLPIAWS